MVGCGAGVRCEYVDGHVHVDVDACACACACESTELLGGWCCCWEFGGVAVVPGVVSLGFSAQVCPCVQMEEKKRHACIMLGCKLLPP